MRALKAFLLVVPIMIIGAIIFSLLNLLWLFFPLMLVVMLFAYRK